MDSNLEITFISHATTLIKIGSVAILTDPCFSNLATIIKRRTPLNYDPSSLPELKAVLISHAHFDHLDRDSFKYIKGNVPVFIPEGLSSLLKRFVQNPIIELSTWATHTFPDGTIICAAASKHRAGRVSHLRFKNINSFVISKGGKTVYFCGDSGYGTHFQKVGGMYKIDVALLPVASYLPKWFMKGTHMTPLEAVQAFLDTKARCMIPIHWGAFKLSLEEMNAPIEWLKKIRKERGLEDSIHILEPGSTWVEN